MTNQTFKVGDRARVVRSVYDQLRPGDIAEIVRMSPVRGLPMLRVPGRAGDEPHVDCLCFEPAWIAAACDEHDAATAAQTLPAAPAKSSSNKPLNRAQNAAKRAVAAVLGIKQKHAHAGMEAYRASYAAARAVQKAGA